MTDQTLFFNIDYDLENIPQADLKSTDGRVFTAILTLTVEVLDEVKLYLKCNKTSFARQQFLRTEL